MTVMLALCLLEMFFLANASTVPTFWLSLSLDVPHPICKLEWLKVIKELDSRFYKKT